MGGRERERELVSQHRNVKKKKKWIYIYIYIKDENGIQPNKRYRVELGGILFYFAAQLLLCLHGTS